MKPNTAVLFVVLALSVPAYPQDKPAERTPWTASKITGSPEPPPPLRADRAFPKLTFKSPVQLVPFPGGGRWVLVEERGMIYSFADDPDADQQELFLDARKEILNVDKIPGCRGVGSTYSLVFDPDFAKNRSCYLMYFLASKERKPLEQGSRVSRFKVTEATPPRIDPASEEVLITWLAGGHNGCDLQFGNDGYLYISAGDGEDPSPPDKLQTGQDVTDLMSSILRIDVHKAGDGKPYAIPSDNPFVGDSKARPEIWCYGLRNPWRMSFDRATGRLWIGDVGWERWEMIYAGERGGNYGWSVMEGPVVCSPDGKRGPTPILPPAASIPHPIAASITGGFVYHGKALKGFEGQYFCGDWESRRVWAFPVKGGALGERREVARTTSRIVAFAQDAAGELLIVDYEAGGLHRLVPADAGAGNAAFPRTLSATGLFSDTAAQAPSTGVLPYMVRASTWTDGATAERWLGLPGSAMIQLVDKNRDWPRESVWPKDSVAAKTLTLSGRKIETQILHFDGLLWNGYSYVWNEAQTDATLAPADGAILDLGGGRKWNVLGRAACMGCHTPWQGTVLSMTSAQLPEFDRIIELGLLGKNVPRQKPWTDPYDESAPLDDRARSYLAVNCGHCHRFGGGGAAKIDLRQEIPIAEMKVAGLRPGLGAFDLTDPYLVCGGDPSRSVLLFRISKLGQGRMPHIGSDAVDERGVRLIRRWIESLPPTPCDPASAATRSKEQACLDRVKAGEAGDCEALLSTPSGALDLLGSLEGLKEAVRLEALRRALGRPPSMIRDLFEAFEPASQRRERLGLSIRPEKILALSGNAEHGRQMFAGTMIQCAKCHRVQAGPDTLGPDLSKIGAKYNRAQLLESILEPSKTIDPKFAGVILQTRAGDVLSVIVVSRTAEELVLRDAEKEIRLPAASVERMAPQQKSLMPEGLLQHLTAQEAADLIAFLESLK
ncbi:MAG TPA: PQQ-dependent sugar dehydrogenase [Planctomycetota bacterium]|nr:PQQ-dependent sugar dehydrogenase [Planctomycetota bacterium]